jgi:hypothetical protein
MKRTVLCAVSALIVGAAGVAAAQPPAPGAWDLTRREAWLQERIDGGVANGSLTRREQHRVQRELRRIRHDEHRLRRREGGVLREGDVARLERRLDELSDHVRWAKHNDDVRRPWA